jgi:hypothetical protein
VTSALLRAAAAGVGAGGQDKVVCNDSVLLSQHIPTQWDSHRHIRLIWDGRANVDPKAT